MSKRLTPDAAFEKMLTKLARRRAVLVADQGGDRGPDRRMRLVSDGIETGSAPRAVFDQARAAGLVEPDPKGRGWRISAKGRETVRRWRSGGGDGLHAVPATGTPAVNEAESPLAWLRRRRGKSGVPLISDGQFTAGERLRADFTFSQMTPRVTVNWNAALGTSSGGSRGGPGMGVDLADNAAAAGERVRRALKAVGPELSGILIDVCCLLKGLEELERRTGWPQRSGKVVLELALTRLQRHYGITDSETGGDRAGRVRHWGGAGYRPDAEFRSADAHHEDGA